MSWSLVLPSEVAQLGETRTPKTLVLTDEVRCVLRACWRIREVKGSARVAAAAGEALDYELWDNEGLPSSVLESLKARLRQLTRVDATRFCQADEFVRLAEQTSEVATSAREENDASWAAYKKKLEALFEEPKKPAPLAVEPAPTFKRPSAARNWELEKKARRTYLEDRLTKLKAKLQTGARKCLEALTPDEQSRVKRALRAHPDEVVAEGFNAEVLGDHAARLGPRMWLVDELINFYFSLLQQRDERLCAADVSRRPTHFLNSFFIAKLLGSRGYDYSGVRRWTKKFDFFSRSKVFCPVNVGNLHWTLLCFDVAKKQIRYFDSMGAPGSTYLNAALRYIHDEHQNKKNEPLPDEWTLVPTTDNTPQQRNGYDCGVFTTFCAHFYALDHEPDFDQADIPHLRNRMLLSILNKLVD